MGMGGGQSGVARWRLRTPIERWSISKRPVVSIRLGRQGLAELPVASNVFLVEYAILLSDTRLSAIRVSRKEPCVEYCRGVFWW